MNELAPKVLFLLALVSSGVGIVDALLTGEWDLLVLFALTATWLVLLWLRQRAHRTMVTLRPDLAHWVEHRAETAGEPFDDVLDRAVAAFKHGIVVDEPTD